MELSIIVKGVTWNKETILNYIERRDDFIEKAIVYLFERQNADEQVISVTKEVNGIGFNKPDSFRMSSYAKLILKGKHLDNKKIQDARKRIRKYSKQILEIIIEKNDLQEVQETTPKA